MKEEICPTCEKGELKKHDIWYRYKTPYAKRLCNERRIYGTIYKCTNEDCSAFFHDDEESEELKGGYPC